MNTKIFFGLISVALFFISCNKTEADITGASASINLVNAVAAEENNDLNMNFTGGSIIYATTKRLSYWASDGTSSNGLLTFGIPSNRTIPLTVTLAEDTTKPIFNQTISCNPGDIYSLFIGGKPTSASYVLQKDTLRAITDSLTGVRFINMSEDFQNISINISGNPMGSEVAQLNYKQITGFKLYPATSTNFSYTFEIRDAITGDFITSFNYNKLARFKHITLIIRGLKDSWPGIEVVRMNNW
ncbi:DUF4397 domain-containing protein [Chitinophaga sp. S165]|uniref:DUF4397 domain-containing protein n=1 Tax=Chitinophaga sp. S165 TaxID=2135462 RepID=UPI000D716EB3|nr:DUF4397 domain-containing protein [Chitinophaga sp. S165]PWV55497.1 hypothetical protein C7475_1013 [Chitinophaga sp. S165]